MNRLWRKDQPSLWESVLPEEVLQLFEELTKVDALLDDERFFAPFREKFSTHLGRPTLPIATYLRMIYLKRWYNLRYENLVKEVKDSFSWRRFCHLAFNDSVPDATVQVLNDALVLKLKEEKLVRGRKLRLDTYVMEADIHHPTDTSLIADGIKVVTRAVSRVKRAGLAQAAPFVKHVRKVKKVPSGISRVVRERVSIANPRLVKVKRELLKLVGEVLVRGREVHRQAEVEVKKGKGKVAQAVSMLGRWLRDMKKVIEQTEAVLKGEKHLPNRLVSLFDTGARPILRGKARSPVEFGRKVLLGETDRGIITTYRVLEGNPSDNTLLCPGVKGHRRLFRKRLRAVTADRGFQSWDNEAWLSQQGVRQVTLPFRGKASKERRQYERQPLYRRLIRFRAGDEGRISVLKRICRLGRSLMRGDSGTRIWVGQGLFAHNLWQAARMM